MPQCPYAADEPSEAGHDSLDCTDGPKFQSSNVVNALACEGSWYNEGSLSQGMGHHQPRLKVVTARLFGAQTVASKASAYEWP